MKIALLAWIAFGLVVILYDVNRFAVGKPPKAKFLYRILSNLVLCMGLLFMFALYYLGEQWSTRVQIIAASVAFLIIFILYFFLFKKILRYWQSKD